MNIRAKIFGGALAEEEPLVVAEKKRKGARTDGLTSVSVPREEARRSNNRVDDRHRLAGERVKIVHKRRSAEVELVNLSGGGAMVSGDFKPKLWDRVALHLGEDGVIECAVRWIKGDRVGLEFAHETRLDCSIGEQAALLRATITRSFPDVAFEVVDGLAEQEARDDESRRERRHPLIWSGLVHHDYQSNPVRLRNISSSGALIECETRLRVGAEPLLDLGEAGQMFATVTWAVGDQAGLKFNEPFDLNQLANAKPEVTPTHWDRPSYLAPGATSDRASAEQWGRMSLGQLRDELEGFMRH